jgi:hypothetical protein
MVLPTTETYPRGSQIFPIELRYAPRPRLPHAVHPPAPEPGAPAHLQALHERKQSLALSLPVPTPRRVFAQ